MNLLYFLIHLSLEAHIDNIILNKSVIFNLVLKNHFGHSPLFINPVKTIKTTQFFRNIRYSYSNSQFLLSFSPQSIWFSNSCFNNLLNNIISSEKYVFPDFNETTFYSSPPYRDQDMVTFRVCNFMDISSLNNNNQPALSTTSQIFRIYSCRFRTCSNTGRGGAIYSNGPDFLLVNDCDFISCSSNSDGGGFYCSNTALICFRNAFQFCSSGGIGGAFMYEDETHIWDLIIQSNLFSRCQASNYNYFYAKFHQTYNNTAYLYFNKFRCLEKEASQYYLITSQHEPTTNYSVFRNAYGDDNYNVHLSPTRTFSPLPTLSPTPPFSDSIMFTPSDSFTLSSPFSHSNVFTLSSPFTPSQLFTPTASFTPSFVFSQSDVFTASNTLIPRTISASQSIFPTPTRSPLNTPVATPSISQTPIFTNSMTFTPLASPFPSETPTISRTPFITWPKLSLGLLILLGIILLLGIIANIYLIMLCCKPSEIFVQQVL